MGQHQSQRTRDLKISPFTCTEQTETQKRRAKLYYKQLATDDVTHPSEDKPTSNRYGDDNSNDNDNNNSSSSSKADNQTAGGGYRGHERSAGEAGWKAAGMAGRKGRSKDRPTVLSALLPGSQITDPSRRILVNAAPTAEVVRFNIGGAVFQTYRSTLHKLPGSPLADDTFLQRYYQPDSNQYFFDRDPHVFGAILNYLRTGELHLPAKFCGPAVKMEMEFWGIDEDEIEECCWTTYSSWTSTLEALRKLEKDRKIHLPVAEEEEGNMRSPGSRLRHLRLQAWTFLNNPRSSIAAQVYSYVALFFVLLSIFSFVAQTHETFRVPVTIRAGETTGTGTNITTSNDTNGSNVTTAPAASAGASEEIVEETEAHVVLIYVDAVCLVFFLVEFVSRVALAPRRLRLLLMPMTIFDFLALLPDVLEFGLRLFRPDVKTVMAVDVIIFLRLLRVFRIFRLMRHFPGLWILFYTLKASLKELLLLLMFVCVGMLFFASLIYYADDREIFPSIPFACWWSLITMTTVGYGDVSPTTQWGYVVGAMTAVCGVLAIGFTVPVLVSNFIMYYHHTQSAIDREEHRARKAAMAIKNAKKASTRSSSSQNATSQNTSTKNTPSQNIAPKNSSSKSSFSRDKTSKVSPVNCTEATSSRGSSSKVIFSIAHPSISSSPKSISSKDSPFNIVTSSKGSSSNSVLSSKAKSPKGVSSDQPQGTAALDTDPTAAWDTSTNVTTADTTQALNADTDTADDVSIALYPDLAKDFTTALNAIADATKKFTSALNSANTDVTKDSEKATGVQTKGRRDDPPKMSPPLPTTVDTSLPSSPPPSLPSPLPSSPPSSSLPSSMTPSPPPSLTPSGTSSPPPPYVPPSPSHLSRSEPLLTAVTHK